MIHINMSSTKQQKTLDSLSRERNYFNLEMVCTKNRVKSIILNNKTFKVKNKISMNSITTSI